MRFEPGSRLGPYEIIAPLGAGGMGEVYRARDPRLGREVALKVLPGEFSGDPARRARFEQEARAAAALNHPNIVGLYDVGTENGVSYFAFRNGKQDLLKVKTCPYLPGHRPDPDGYYLSLSVASTEIYIRSLS